MTVDFDQVTLQDISRRFGRRRALSNVTLTCRAGEVLGLLGPNGAGKSTIISILATLLTPSSGTIRYGGHEPGDRGPQLRARLGLLAHDLYLYPELTGRENLEFFCRLYGLPDAPALTGRALERVGLAERGDDLVLGYSRGMRQRLALERALIHRPRLVLLDEPFTGLDQTSVAALVQRLKGLRDDGSMVIISTHDLEIAENLLDRIAVLRDGRIVAVEASAGAVRSRYTAHMQRA